VPRSSTPATALCSILSLTAFVNATLAAPRHATQTDEERQEEVDLLKEIDNPFSNLIRLNIRSDWDFGIGSTKAMHYSATLNPLIPFSLNDDWSLIVRTFVPMTYAESPASGIRTKTGLGDISQTFYVSPKKSMGQWIWGLGPTFLFPSASEHGLGGEKWAAGPAMGVLQQRNGWTYGVLISQLWSFAGESSRPSVNGTTIAPFVSYITKRLTSVGLNVGSVYDWRLGRETLPVELSTTQVLKIGGQYVSFSLGGRYYAQKLAAGPDWGMDFTVSLLFPGQTGSTAIANPFR